MFSCILKLILFWNILEQLTLIYNNNCYRLYKNTNNGNIALIRTNFRSLAELSHKHTTNYKYENKGLKEYGNKNDKKYKKNKYPKNDVKSKQNVLEVPKNENTRTANSKKYTNEKYNKEKEAKSNRSSSSIKYLKRQSKHYNNVYEKSEMDFEKLTDKSNNKSPEHPNKKKSSDKISSSSKDHDKNLVNLETACVGGAYACTVPTAFVVKWGIEAGILAAESFISTELGKNIALAVTNALAGVNIFSAYAIQNAAGHIANFGTNNAALISGAAWTSFTPYVIAAIVIILIVLALIILYIYLRKRRKKKSRENEYKKHLCN